MRPILFLLLCVPGFAAQAQIIITIEANGTLITEGEVQAASIGEVDTAEYAEVYSYDWSAQVIGRDGGLATGRVTYGPIRIVKAIARSSVLLRTALSQNQVVDVEIRFFRPNPADGSAEQYYVIRGINGRVTGIRPWADTTGATPGPQFLEEVSFEFATFEFEELDSGLQALIQVLGGA